MENPNRLKIILLEKRKDLQMAFRTFEHQPYECICWRTSTSK